MDSLISQGGTPADSSEACDVLLSEPADRSPTDQRRTTTTLSGGRNYSRIKLKRRTWDWRNSRFLLSAGLGASAIGLLVAGAAWEFRQHDPTAVTVTVPPPASLSTKAVASLPPPDLLKPLSPDEASKENADRPFVGRSDNAAGHFVLKTDAEDSTRAQTCLAQAIYYEAASEGVDGGRAVAQVVLNRMHHPGFPSTVCGVIYEGADRATGCQFSFACDGSMRRIPIPSLWTRSRKIAEEALAGKVFAPVGHSTHYHADYVLPYWADSLDKSVQIGRHIFYRLRSVFGEGRAFSQRYAGSEQIVREPGATVILPPAAVTPQLANALISDEPQTGIKVAEKAAPQPTSALAVDASRGILLADGDSTNQAADSTKRPKPAATCSSSGDGKQLQPIGPNDVRSSSTTSSCSR